VLQLASFYIWLSFSASKETFRKSHLAGLPLADVLELSPYVCFASSFERSVGAFFWTQAGRCHLCRLPPPLLFFSLSYLEEFQRDSLEIPP
jgi:hypothetical protein